MRKALSLIAGLAVVTLAAAVAVPANAITGGTTAKEAGPNVGISLSDGNFCSGTLLNLHLVLTAWHCFSGGATGTVYWGSTKRKKGHKIATSTVWHEDDLALVYLMEEVPFDEVAYPSLGTADPQVGDTVQFFGFGQDKTGGELSSALRTGSAIVKRNDGRLDAFKGPSFTTEQNGDGSPALGDSGGGAYLDGKLVGVQSVVGSTSTSNGAFEIADFASVAAHLPFINQILEG